MMNRRHLLRLSIAGYAVGIIVIVAGLRMFGPTGDVGRLFDPVGDAFREGRPVYVAGVETPFFYAPPWAILLGVTSAFPVEAQVLLVWVLNLAALRYMAGSWLAVGWIGYVPLVAWSLVGATFNLAMAAVIMAGVRGAAALPTVLAFAKVSPILAVPPVRWRTAALAAALLVLVTLPWLELWPAWVDQLLRYAGTGIGPQVPIPLVVRLPVACGLMLIRRPWATALAAAVAIPSFYWESLVVLLAPILVYLRFGEVHRRPAMAMATA